jgi:hypothetical protein
MPHPECMYHDQVFYEVFHFQSTTFIVIELLADIFANGKFFPKMAITQKFKSGEIL